MDDLKGSYSHQQVELERLRISVEQAQYAQREVQERNSPRVSAPLRILPSMSDEAYVRPPKRGGKGCRQHLCFDYSRYCIPLTGLGIVSLLLAYWDCTVGACQCSAEKLCLTQSSVRLSYLILIIMLV